MDSGDVILSYVRAYYTCMAYMQFVLINSEQHLVNTLLTLTLTLTIVLTY